MTTKRDTYYQALLAKDAAYDGVFFVGVRTTGVFCRPTCPARKPRLENCEFFADASAPLIAGYRPCKRCQPLRSPAEPSDVVRILVEAVEARPEYKWRSQDVRALAIDPSTARRQFMQRFGLTFIAYARQRRLGLAFKQIRAGASVTDAQFSAGYDSSSGFRDAFERIMGTLPSRVQSSVLEAAWLESPLGAMLAIADDRVLYLLEFVDRRGLETEIERLRRRCQAAIIPGRTAPIVQIESELQRYFSGDMTPFSTPLAEQGTPFQRQVWAALVQIPAGETRSYAQIASAIERPSSVRAVARANGANTLAIIVPCHRVIGSDGQLTGYGGGLARKQWLIEHEASASAR